MNNQTAIFLDIASVYPGDLDFSLLEKVAEWQWFDDVKPGVNLVEVQNAIETAEIIVSNKVMLGRDVIDRCKRLQLICVAATGVNNIDIEAAKHRNITVCNVRAYATPSVAQHVYSLILALNRRLLSFHQSAKNGNWSSSDFFCYFDEPFDDLEGKTIGIIGYGELGRAVAKMADCFGMNVLVARRQLADGQIDMRKNRVALDELLSASDIVTLHCPLTENNRNLISKTELSLMKSDAILINAARGGLVDEYALLDALNTHQIAGAALDVLDEEPPPVDHALLNYQGDNLIITPHVAWASRASRQRLLDEVAENIRAFQQGKSRNIV